MEFDRIKVFTCCVVIFFSLLLCFNDLVWAHDKSKPELNSWFNSLKSKTGFACCSDADGTALVDTDWESKNGKYRVFVNGQWYDVPDEAVLTTPNRDGRTIVWPIYFNGILKIVCFIPGVMT